MGRGICLRECSGGDYLGVNDQDSYFHLLFFSSVITIFVLCWCTVISMFFDV